MQSDQYIRPLYAKLKGNRVGSRKLSADQAENEWSNIECIA